MPNSIPEKPWIYISEDFITKLPLAQGYDSILVVVDWLTKMVHFIPTTERMLVEGLARLFRDNRWKLYSLPKSIIGQRTIVCSKINERAKQNVGDQKQDVNGILPSDRQTNREG